MPDQGNKHMSSQLPFTDFPEGTVTFLFTDIEGSTELLKQLRDQYARLLADQREILRATFDKWGGREVDTQGDAFFVAFPRATDAVNAAVDIQRALAAHDWPNGVEVRVRMGLHTGEPWVGEEGYVGMDVHRAARIAHVGHGGQVLLSETTAPLLRDELPNGVRLLDLGRHRLKDIKGPEHIRQLVIEDLPSEFPPLRSLEALPPEFPLEPGPVRLPAFLEAEEEVRSRPIFVCRERELSRLEGYLDETLAGKGGVVFVTGGPGRGKTAIIHEFACSAMDKHADLLVACGECSAYTGVGDPYLPFKQILAMLTGDLESRWSRGTISRQQALRLWETMPMTIQTLMANGPDLIDVFVPGKGMLERSRVALEGGRSLLERLAKLCESERALPGELEQANLFEQVEQVLASIATEHPLILLLDDLQWADSASIQLLFHLGRQIQDVRILILGSYRPSEVTQGRKGEPHPLEKVLAEFKRQLGDIWINLSETPETEAQAFVDAFVDSEPNRLSKDFHKALYEHTAGHPLFTVELLRNMQERGDLDLDAEGFWVAGSRLDWSVLPTRVEGVIEERIGRLEADLRETLTIASVEGEDFTAQVVGQVQEVSERKILTRLSRELEKRHRLVKVGEEIKVGGHILSSYRFTHTLFQQYMYNDLSAGERRILHGEVARVLEQLYAGQTEGIAVQLAYHYSQAKEADQAIHYLLMAGDQARTSYAYEEAIDFYERALTLQKEQGYADKAARTLMKLGLTYHAHLDFQRAHEAYVEGFDLWRQVGETPPDDSIPPAPHPLRISSYYPPTLDSTRAYDVISDNVIIHLFSGLVELTPGLDIIPDVARSWDVLESGRRYIFHLREDAAWSDGKQVTAGDFEYAWKRILEPTFGAQNAPLLYDIKGAMAYHQGRVMDPSQIGVMAIDDVTLEVELEEPTGYFMHLLAFSALYPIPKHIVETCGEGWTEVGNIVTNGPFNLKAFIPGDHLLLERNPRYHGRYTGNVQHIALCLVEDMSSSVQLYESDQLDILRLWGVAPQELDRVRQRRAGEYMSYPGADTCYLGFDVSQNPFNDIRVRQAFAMSIDKETLNHVALKGIVFPATGGFVSPNIPGHSEGIGLPYDPEQAQRLLAEAGYPEGRGFPLVEALTSYAVAPYVEFLRSGWEDILGIDIPWEVLEVGEYLERIFRQPVQIYAMHWQADYPDPDNFLRTSGIQQQTSFRSDIYRDTIETARYTPDQSERMRLYGQADRMLIEEAIIVPLSYVPNHILVKPWVKKCPVSSFRWLYGKYVTIEPH
jgi:ABC-type oligopeptide transport system substrate-binding subunit/class 3 adenylate cyclase/ABC-type transporter Mla MlaB component